MAVETSCGSRVASIVMAAFFAFAVVVQHNDPDSARWMAIYGAAGGLSLLASFVTLRPVLPALVAAIALAWAVTLAPRVLGGATVAEMFRSYAMMSPQMEEGRELLGLLIVTTWMAVLAARRGTAAPEPHGR